MATSPSYSTSGPSSVHGGVSGSFALQSRLNWKLLMMSLVPFWMLPVPKSMDDVDVTDGVTAGAPT